MNGGGGGGGGGGDSEAGQEAREEADARSVHVGGVDYATTPEELQQHFQGCGTVNRVTILTDRYENPKGFAYVEFLETDAVTNAIALTDSEIHGRKLKVNAKRTNVPGMKAGGGRGGGGDGRQRRRRQRRQPVHEPDDDDDEPVYDGRRRRWQRQRQRRRPRRQRQR